MPEVRAALGEAAGGLERDFVAKYIEIKNGIQIAAFEVFEEEGRAFVSGSESVLEKSDFDGEILHTSFWIYSVGSSCELVESAKGT